jgi:muconolactone delta-isomerase
MIPMPPFDWRTVRADHVRRHPSANCGGLREDFAADELEFARAVDSYKRDNRKPFPDWSEILLIVKALGYAKVYAGTAAEQAAATAANEQYAARIRARAEKRALQRARHSGEFAAAR